MKWFRYDIDYEYGRAVLFTKKQFRDPLEVFYDLADQCFGIRKSIGETKLLDENLVELPAQAQVPQSDWLDTHPEFDNPMQRVIEGIGPDSHEITDNVRERANFILVHSGGDLIAWDRKNHKIESEWGDNA